ncbi:hypothetical protein ABIB25_004989 [Nakamurella sp. UYEF19]
MSDQYTMRNPVNQYTSDDFPEQQQDGPGLDADLAPRPTTARSPTEDQGGCPAAKPW